MLDFSSHTNSSQSSSDASAAPKLPSSVLTTGTMLKQARSSGEIADGRRVSIQVWRTVIAFGLITTSMV